ncbi:MAG: DUF4340 domain-containing protein [Gammaproteobacteria bacterium]|nr:DUF4340 domain-containing protein [Gammaproteobacteria bacterium]
MAAPDAPNNEQTVSAAATPSAPSGLKRRWWLNIGLLAVIALLAALVIQQTDQDKKPAGPALSAIVAANISQIRIEKNEQAPIVLEKIANEWRLTAPLPARANPFNVDSLLKIISASTETRFAAVAADLANYGLDKPAARVRYNNDEIIFGALHPLKSQVYVMYKNEIALIPAFYLASPNYPYTNFISSRLFEEDRKLTMLKLPNFTLALSNGAWSRQPLDQKLSTDRLNDFAAEWQNARALSVEKYSGKAAIGEIEISSTRDAKNEKLSLGILAYKPDFILHRSDENLEYHFTEETGKRLLNISLQ